MPTGMLPYDLTQLAAGGIRVIVHPISTTLFSTPVGAFDQESPYAATEDGRDLGATTGACSYDRNFTTTSFKIQQTSQVVLEQPDEMIRSIKVPMGEITTDNLGLFENSEEIVAIAAATGHSAFSTLHAGDVSDATAYRVTFAGMRQKQQGLVTESDDTTTRGRFYGFIAYRATFTADSSTISFDKGALMTATVTLKLYPDPTITNSKRNTIVWFDEAAGAIA